MVHPSPSVSSSYPCVGPTSRDRHEVAPSLHEVAGVAANKSPPRASASSVTTRRTSSHPHTFRRSSWSTAAENGSWRTPRRTDVRLSSRGKNGS